MYPPSRCSIGIRPSSACRSSTLLQCRREVNRSRRHFKKCHKSPPRVQDPVIHFGSFQPSSHRTLSSSPIQTAFVGFGTTGALSNDLAPLLPSTSPPSSTRDGPKGFRRFPRLPPPERPPRQMSPLLRRYSPGSPHPGRERDDVKTAVEALKSQVSKTDTKKAFTKALSSGPRLRLTPGMVSSPFRVTRGRHVGRDLIASVSSSHECTRVDD